MKTSHKVLCGSTGSALLLAYGGGAIMVSRFVATDTNLVWWGQVLLVLALGVGCLVWAIRAAQGTIDDKPVDPHPDVPQPVSDSDIVSACQAAQAVRTLAKRMAGHKDALELCRKLQDCLFVLEYASGPDDTDHLSG
jgi:hypothetical protein|tara:strand:- start:19 stop:429 length:411 start_codon:yes stop_codon:yes gene_type:complete